MKGGRRVLVMMEIHFERARGVGAPGESRRKWSDCIALCRGGLRASLLNYVYIKQIKLDVNMRILP